MTEPLYRVIVEGFKGIFAVLGMKLDIVGEENIPLQGGAVLALNHTSYLDFALGGVPADRRGRRFVRFMAKDSVFRHPIAGPLMRGMKHIPVDRHDGSVAFETAVAAARAGELIGVFPEATMSRSLEIKELKNGAVRMAREAEVPLIPMIVFGGHRVLSYDVRDFTRGRTICMTIGRPISTNDDVDEMTDALRSTLSELLDETIQRYPDKQPGAPWIPQRHGGSAPSLEEAARIEERRRAARETK
ncbi:MAG: 1-acyl-sn-glycerol-3-phosphate acyltransferase [Rubrivirga sp.]|jgi:1-acyl-sn-glycerol-3-phosphate acyltransferase|nr:1-acyl-sn-glycerol-3-phosphate acyltransferase [Rubrivirga sp.]|tara:strand:+ start:437 stop:1171 length:735 start_codon:yes stop_codon:yes gene_type:complete